MLDFIKRTTFNLGPDFPDPTMRIDSPLLSQSMGETDNEIVSLFT